MPAAGGDAFPISYGDFDNVNPRWSPDGSKIAFISNRDWQYIVVGANDSRRRADRRSSRANGSISKPMGNIALRVVDETGSQWRHGFSLPAADGLAYAPDGAWMYADDSFDRSERPFEAHYFDTTGVSEITVPAGTVEVGVMRGFENHSSSVRSR